MRLLVAEREAWFVEILPYRIRQKREGAWRERFMSLQPTQENENPLVDLDRRRPRVVVLQGDAPRVPRAPKAPPPLVDKIKPMLQISALAELMLCYVLWSLAFVEVRKKAAGQKKVVRAPASRWGIVLEFVGFALVWSYVRPVGFEKSAAALIASMILGPPSVVLAWAATRHLGKQWRYEAALSEDHELIQTGPYGWIRHPIYASMLGMFLATGAAWTWWPMFLLALAAFLAGTEIRVRAEDRLLAERFQESFTAYRSRVPAYLPFFR